MFRSRRLVPPAGEGRWSLVRPERPAARAKPDATARLVFLLPAILIVLCLSIFPLIVSLALSFARVTFMGGGINIAFVGFSNYHKLLFGSQQRHLIGKLGELSPLAWVVFLGLSGLLLAWFYAEIRQHGLRVRTIALNALMVVFALGLLWITLSTLSGEGLPGTLATGA